MQKLLRFEQSDILILFLFLPQLDSLYCHISCYDSFQFSFITLPLIFEKFFELSKIFQIIIIQICHLLCHGKSLH